MTKNNGENVKLIGKITTKNIVYDFSDSNFHKLIFLDSKRKLEGKLLFSINTQTSSINIGNGIGDGTSKVSLLTGEFVWQNHPEFVFSFEFASPKSKFIIAKCKKIGAEKFYTYDQIVFDDVEVNNDLTMKGKVLVPLNSTEPGNFNFKWRNFEGTIRDTLINIQIGEAKWSWSFKRVT
jgi:hypothetical protein